MTPTATIIAPTPLDLAGLTVHIIPLAKSDPHGKLADAELHFITGPLEGMKLIGFGIWQQRNGGTRNVTFPARSYAVNGERRSFSILRPSAYPGERLSAQQRVVTFILQAYDQFLANN